jgi:hypothetical protein
MIFLLYENFKKKILFMKMYVFLQAKSPYSVAPQFEPMILEKILEFLENLFMKRNQVYASFSLERWFSSWYSHYNLRSL